MGHKLAIDFGTTNSVIAVYDEATAVGKSVPVPGISIPASEGAHLIPTLLYVEDGRSGQVRIGAAAGAAGTGPAYEGRLFRNFKRSIGADRSEARLIDGAPWTEMDAGRAFLGQLISAQPYLVEEIDQLVVTVPVAMFEGYTAWLQRAFAGFPANRMRVVDESTAAALGYAITEPGAVVLVIDFGGGTLDLSLVRLPESREKTGKILFTAQPERGTTASVIAKVGMALGGSDIDQWLVEYLLSRLGLSADQLGTNTAALLAACEQAKIALSTQDAVEVYFNLEDGGEQRITITRAELEAAMEQHGFYQALRGALDKVMGLAHQKGVFREDIGHVVLVGGTSLIPSVQQALDGYFRSITQRHKRLFDIPEWPALTWKVDTTTIRVDKPFTAVVEGALQVSAGFGLEDHLAHGYGLRYLDPQSGELRYEEIIPTGSKYPSPKPVSIILSAAHASQAEIDLVVGQIHTGAITAVEVQHPGGQAVFVARAEAGGIEVVPLNERAPLRVTLDPPGQAGKERLRAEFTVDARRALRVTVTDRKTRRVLAADALVSRLGEGESQAADADESAGAQSAGVETAPALAHAQPGAFRLPLHRLTSLFEMLPGEQMGAEVLAAALRSDDCMIRFSAAETLARRGDREARELFADILNHGLPHQRASAAQHIYHFSWFAASPLFELALRDSDPRTREAAVFALCRMRLPEAYRRVLEILQAGSESMRMAAVWGLQSHPDAAAVPVLALAAQAGRGDIRVQAMEVLGATESDDAIPVVRRGAADLSPEVKYAAVLSWVELAGVGSLAPLAEMIENTTGLDRRAILHGLFHATNYMGIDCGGAPSADRLIDALEKALGDGLPAARLAASMQLAWMRNARAEAVLVEGFERETDSSTRAQMLANVVNLMSPVGKRLLEESLRSEDAVVRQTAEYLCGQNGYRAAGKSSA